MVAYKNVSKRWGELRLLRAYDEGTIPPSVVVGIHHLQVSKLPLSVDWYLSCRDCDRVFYISATDSKGNFQFVDDEVCASWSSN